VVASVLETGGLTRSFLEKESEMSEKRINVWVQRFKDRPTLQRQWIDPVTNRRKTRSTETTNENEAEGQRKDLEYELNHGLYQETVQMPWATFRQLFEEEYVAGTRKNTRRNFQDTLDLFERLCTVGRINSITERTLSTFVAAMRKTPTRGRSGMMPSTIKVRLQYLRTALRWAVGQKLLPTSPKFPSVKVPGKDPQPVPPETFERLVAKAPDQMMRVYLLTGWLAGLRLEEAYVLEWEETTKAPYINFSDNRIVLPAELVKAARDQWVPLDPLLREALEAMPRAGKKVFRFISRRTGRPLTLSGISDRVVDLAKKAGVRLTMHALRRGFGCRYAGKVPAQVLQKLMRHSNIRTTMAYYANVDDAVMTAVLGEQCNSSRNTCQTGIATRETTDSSSTSQDCTSESIHRIR